VSGITEVNREAIRLVTHIMLIVLSCLHFKSLVRAALFYSCHVSNTQDIQESVRKPAKGDCGGDGTEEEIVSLSSLTPLFPIVWSFRVT